MTTELTPTEAWLLIAVLTYVEQRPPVDIETRAVQKALGDLRQWRSALLQAYLHSKVAGDQELAIDGYGHGV
jgi:hypothetical protein